MLQEKFTKEYIIEKIDKTIEAIEKALIAEEVVLDTKQTYQSFKRASMKNLRELLSYWVELYQELYGNEDIQDQLIYLDVTFGGRRC